MNVYTSDKIRNVVLLGHGGSGKTTLVESMAYLSGITTRMGNINNGNTISDYDKEEQKRKFSISTSVVPIEWDSHKINLFDTPGYFDFVGEVEEAVAAAAGAIIVVSGKAGIEVGTEKAWDLCDKYNIPRIVFVTDMDVDNASFRQVVEDLTEKYGKKIAPFHLPIRENEKFVGYVNVVSENGYRWVNGGKGCRTLGYVWGVAQTFFFITFTRLFFRSGSNLDPATANEEAWKTATNMVHQIGSPWAWDLIPDICANYWKVFALVIAGMAIHWLPERWKRWYRINFAMLPLPVMAVAVVAIVFVVYQFITADLQAFIYFQF